MRLGFVSLRLQHVTLGDTLLTEAGRFFPLSVCATTLFLLTPSTSFFLARGAAEILRDEKRRVFFHLLFHVRSTCCYMLDRENVYRALVEFSVDVRFICRHFIQKNVGTGWF